MTVASFWVLRINKEIKRNSYNFFFVTSIFFLWLTFTMSENFSQVLSYFVKYVPLFLVLFWPVDIICKSYKFIRFVVIFFAVGGAVVSIMTITDLISHIPYYVIPPQETLHERLGCDYHVYGVFPTLNSPSALVTGVRACGMMKEPGHFAIILGYIYLIDRYLGNKINLWIIIAGILTFSSTFFIIAFFTEIRYIFKKKFIVKVIKYAPLIVLLLISVYFILPSGIRDQINYLFFERNLAEVVDALNTSSSLSEGLDMRANVTSVSTYEHISTLQFWTGGVEFDSSLSLADYRGLILRIGLIGVILSFLTYVSATGGGGKALRISLVLIYLLIIAHRSWMLQAPYLYFLSFLVVTVYSFSQKTKSRVRI